MVTIKWLGHATFEIDMADKIILIDPFLKDNPQAAVKPSEIQKVDVMAVTHNHYDHFADTVEIAKKHDATVVAVYEAANAVTEQGVEKTVGLNIGGAAKIDGLYITLTPAFHSCMSNPSGVILSDGKISVYHAGDASIFSDMKLIGRMYKPRVALLPIGGFYTMGPLEAAMAAALIKPKVVIPHHYGTFDTIKHDPNEFVKFVRRKAKGVKVIVLKPGESYGLVYK
ncbi:MAG: metal-dependent hydrolase [Nitrososphaerota archaeon]|nr:metal-dependent hydrolase [Aigarchaeota archaeon]MDW8076256.1 metal-dependent hydrolase [Nitrososphaerota archaeon]